MGMGVNGSESGEGFSRVVPSHGETALRGERLSRVDLQRLLKLPVARISEDEPRVVDNTRSRRM